MNQQQNIRGRGAADNPKNRFERLATVRDIAPELGPDDEILPPQTEHLKMASKTILTSNNSPDVGFNLSINPYNGCSHGCAYCYARPYHEYWGLSAGLDFETKILVKEDAPELLRKALMSKKYEPQVIAISGVTDCYQPSEKQFRLTRRCLEVLAEFKNPVSIITKNRLVTRDIDILQKLAADSLVTVNLSVTSLKLDVQQSLEPRTSTPKARLEAIRTLTSAGIPTCVMVAPVIPGLTDEEVPAILQAVAEAGALGAGWVPVRLPYAVAPIFEDWLERNFPLRKERVLNRIRSMRGGKLNDPNFGSRMSGEGAFAEQMQQMFELGCRKAGISQQRPKLRTDLFKRPLEGQLDLF
jgi:DNA repair photolyase